jgi:hypothetical protein
MLLHPYGGADLRLGQREMPPQSSHSGTLVMRFVFDEVTAMRGLRVWNYNGIIIIITPPRPTQLPIIPPSNAQTLKVRERRRCVESSTAGSLPTMLSSLLTTLYFAR